MIRRPDRAVAVVLLCAVLVLGPATAASAHVGGGPQPSNYAGAVTAITPAMPGVTIRAIDNGDRLELRNPTGVPVVVYGYDHRPGTAADPYLTVSADGVWTNQNSAATYLNTTFSGTGVAVPAGAGASAPVRWVKQSADPVARWHDHRTHWMGAADPPQVVADPGHSHVVIAGWTVSLAYGGQPVTVTGSLVWNPPPATWPWWVAVGLVLLAAGGGCAMRSWRRPVAVAVGVLVAADLAHLATSPLPSDPAQGSRAFAVVSAVVPSLAVLVLAVVVWRLLRRGSAATPYPLGIAGWLVGLQGLSDVSVLWHAHLPQSGPEWLARGVVVLSVGLGLGLGLGAVALRRQLSAAAEPPAVVPAAG